MLRTKSVKLKTIPAMAFRIKTPEGPSITIQRADQKQPGIASVSKTSGKAIISPNTNLKYYPEEAFEEAIRLTNGLTYKRQKENRQKGIKVTKEMVKEKKVKEPEEVIIDSTEYLKIIDKYSDKNGKLSYDLKKERQRQRSATMSLPTRSETSVTTIIWKTNRSGRWWSCWMRLTPKAFSRNSTTRSGSCWQQTKRSRKQI